MGDHVRFAPPITPLTDPVTTQTLPREPRGHEPRAVYDHPPHDTNSDT
ncbi:hypothetical protein SEA_LUCKYSOCKE_219 [Streptomyces phage LuckySocke]|nr:hypothetical protein SEA_LUCKYSOCKE_219 [Streptomyces phage LuckySocke]